METVETQKKNRKYPQEIQVLFWLIILSAVIFLGFQIYSAFWPKTGQEASLFSGTATDKKGIQIGNLAPDFTAQTVEGETINLADFRGKKPVLLVFWATWCGFCAKELEDLKAFTSEYQKEIQVIAVASGEPRETIRDYIEEKDINFLMLLDEDRKIWKQYFVRGTPSHFLISSQGKIVTLRPGLASREDLEIMMTMLTELR